jgi:YD repeat-containing protein
MSVNLAALQKAGAGTVNAEPLFYKYRYDQLNRLKRMDAFKGLTGNQWTPIHPTKYDYEETVNYDPNGNILSYNRNGSPTLSGKAERMDVLTYNYKPLTNQLDHVLDSVPAGAYTEDIDGQSSGNYVYDKIGNLVSDDANNMNNANSIDLIKWTVYGKISEINKHSGTVIKYGYDASGNRISKTVVGVKNNGVCARCER